MNHFINNPENILEFVKDKSFDDIKYELSQAPFRISVRDSGKLYMLNFTEFSDLTVDICRECNGIILEKETNKLVHWSFPKTKNGVEVNWTIYGAEKNERDYYISTITDAALKDKVEVECSFEVYTEGTLIKVFYYNNSWNVATTHNINASMSFWNNDKSFKELFLESMKYCELNLKDLDKKYCYSFIFQHPENSIYKTISVPLVKEIGRYDCANLKEEKIYDNVYTSPDKNLDYFLSDKNTREDVIAYIGQDRVKILSKETLYHKEKINKKNKALEKILADFTANIITDDYDEEEKIYYKKFTEKITQEAILIYTQYQLKNIKKQKIKYLDRHASLLYDLHKSYLTYRTPVSLEYVTDFLRLQLKFLYSISL